MAIRGLPRRFHFPGRTVLDIHRDVDDELAFHLDMRIAELRDRGLDTSEAEGEALRQFGDLDAAKRQIKAWDRRAERRRRSTMMLDELMLDARFALRSLRKRPAFSSVAILVLALGIGVNSAMFSLIDMVMMKPLAIERPHEVVGVYSRDAEEPDRYRAFSYPLFRDLREQNQAFANLAGFTLSTVGLADDEITRRVMAAVVSSGYFETFGLPPAHGRGFTREEELPGAELPVVVVSHGLWQRYGGRDDYLGSTLRINGRPLTVVGIAARGFTGTTALFSPEVWLPLGMFELASTGFGVQETRSLEDPDNFALMLLGRLRADLDAAAALPGLERLAAQLAERFPEAHEKQTIILAPLGRLGIGTEPLDESSMFLPTAMLMALAAIVLLIACLDLMNMFLARGESRRSEIALRVALGGGRMRLLRQHLSEGLLLSLVGGAVGLAMAYVCTRLFFSSIGGALPIDVSLVADPTPDLRVALATLVFCIVATLLFAFGPAWRQTAGDVFAGLRDNVQPPGKAGRIGRLLSIRGLLVVSQVALSMVLLTAAGLFVRGSLEAAEATPGFELENSLLVELDTSLLGYDEVRGREIYRQAKQRLSALPGVDQVGLASLVPYGSVTISREVRRPGASIDDAAVKALRYVIGEDYFGALDLPLLAGRAFTERETWNDDGRPVAIIDQPLAERLWPGQDPVGRLLEQVVRPPAEPLPPLEVVGVVPGIMHRFTDKEPPPHVYLPFGQHWNPGMHLHVRLAQGTTGAAAQSSLKRAIRDEIRVVDAGLPVLSLGSMLDHRDQSVFMWAVKIGGKVFAALGALALVLALVGVYGVKAYVTSRRTREIGVRMALGATPSVVMRQMLQDGLQLTAIGLGVGLLLALGISRLLASMLYQVTPGDPVVFATAAVVLTTAALFAAWIPVRRACRIPPTEALRHA